MSIKLYNKISVLLCALFLTLLSGCIKENAPNESKESLSLNQFSISVNIPTESLPKNISKSGQTAAESQVNEIEVLVFENGNYAYKVAGEDLIQSNNSAVFHARLRSSTVPTTLYIVANNNAIIDANEPEIGTPIDQAKTLFNIGFAASGIAANTALWGSHTLDSGINGSLQNELNDIVLIRAIARVDVEVAPTASNFVLQTIQIFRAANTIQIIPNSPNSELSVTTPSIPVGNLYNVNSTPVNVNSPTTSTAQIYIPESAAPDLANQVAQATCIVVGGRYNNAATNTFYRLDFNPQIEGHPLGQILRNQRYLFSISEVNSNGFATAALAASNPSSGMNTQLFSWPADNIHYMFFDSNNFFGIEQNIINLQGVINSSLETAVSTDAGSYELRFIDGQVTPWSTSLNDGVFSVTQINGGTRLLFATLANHFLSTPRQRTVQVRSGNIDNIILTLIQEPTEYNGQWSLVNVDAPGTFANNLNSFGMLYIWNNRTAYPNSGTVANWATGVSVSFTWAAQQDPCPPGWQIPTVAQFNQLIRDYPGFRLYTGTDSANPNQGLWIAPTQAEANSATFQNPDNALFFPFSGTRSSATAVASVNVEGTCYARDGEFPSNLRLLRINRTTAPAIITLTNNANIARPIRCIRQ